MKDKLKASFENVLSDYDARAQDAQRQQDQKATDRRKFEAECRRVMEAVIVPALDQAAREVLRPHGWICEITSPTPPQSPPSSRPREVEVRMNVYRDSMTGVAGTGRPHLSFVADDFAAKVRIRYATTNQSSGGGEGFDLGTINEGFVQDQLLRFVQRLTGK
jgi:hypothetical protein